MLTADRRGDRACVRRGGRTPHSRRGPAGGAAVCAACLAAGGHGRARSPDGRVRRERRAGRRAHGVGDGGALGPGRLRGQLRRRAGPPEADGDVRRERVGPRAGRQHARRLPVRARAAARHEQAGAAAGPQRRARRAREHRQHRVERGTRRRFGPAGLCCQQARRRWHHQGCRHRVRGEGHPVQCDCARRSRHARESAQGSGEGVGSHSR